MSSDTCKTGAPDIVAEHIQRLAHELLPQSERIAALVVEPVLIEVPQVSPRGPHTATRSTQQNISAMLATLAFGLDPSAFAPPPATLELVRDLLDADGDLTAILRGYRIGHQRFWDVWAGHVGDHVADRDELQAVLSTSSTSVFALFDSVVAGIVAYHRTQLDQRTEADPARRSAAAAIAALLGPRPVDLDATSDVLGYDLRGHHVAAVVVPSAPERGIRTACDELARRLGQPSAISHPVGDGSVWMWFGWSRKPDAELLRSSAAVPLSDAVIGLGEPTQGREGFRRSHDQALEAQHIRGLHSDPQPGIVLHQDVALAAILCADPDRARSFARRHLGPLAHKDQSTAHLRDTLRAFYACGHNKARTAELLFVHQRTVSYRMARAEELLGTDVERHAAELQAALIVVDTLGD